MVAGSTLRAEVGVMPIVGAGDAAQAALKSATPGQRRVEPEAMGHREIVADGA
jgi:hypothetical protein